MYYIVVLLGNAIVMALEALLVAIQVLIVMNLYPFSFSIVY